MVVVLVLLAVVALVGVVVLLRAVFGGSTFRRDRSADRAGDGRPGALPDSHAGAGRWPGGGGLGTWNTWSGGSGGGSGDSGGS